MLLRRGRIPRDEAVDEAYRILKNILWNDCWKSLPYQSPEGIATIIIKELKRNGYAIRKER